jgi:hypothetical protein
MYNAPCFQEKRTFFQSVIVKCSWGRGCAVCRECGVVLHTTDSGHKRLFSRIFIYVFRTGSHISSPLRYFYILMALIKNNEGLKRLLQAFFLLIIRDNRSERKDATH